MAVAVERAGKRVLIRADTVPPADAAVKGLIVVHKGNVRAELHGLPGESVARADELCQARKLPRRGQRELRAPVAVPIGLGQLRPDLVRRIRLDAQAQRRGRNLRADRKAAGVSRLFAAAVLIGEEKAEAAAVNVVQIVRRCVGVQLGLHGQHVALIERVAVLHRRIFDRNERAVLQRRAGFGHGQLAGRMLLDIERARLKRLKASAQNALARDGRIAAAQLLSAERIAAERPAGFGRVGELQNRPGRNASRPIGRNRAALRLLHADGGVRPLRSGLPCQTRIAARRADIGLTVAVERVDKVLRLHRGRASALDGDPNALRRADVPAV